MTLLPIYFGYRPTLHYLRLGLSNFPFLSDFPKEACDTSISTYAKFRANLTLLDLSA